MYVGTYVHTYIHRRQTQICTCFSALCCGAAVDTQVHHTYLFELLRILPMQIDECGYVDMQLAAMRRQAIIYVPTYIPMYTHRVSKGGISFAHLNNVEVPFILLPALICGSYIPTTYMTYQPSGRRIPFQKFIYSTFYSIKVLQSLLKKRSATVRTLFNAHATVTRSTCIPTYLSIYFIRNLKVKSAFTGDALHMMQAPVRHCKCKKSIALMYLHMYVSIVYCTYVGVKNACTHACSADERAAQRCISFYCYLI